MPAVGRLFAGTPFDRPPVCERCGQLESACSCPPVVAEPVRIPPGEQTARLKVEKRPKGKVVTAVSGLDSVGNDLTELAAKLKSRCGVGGTVKEGVIELQGDHLASAEVALKAIGYQVRRG